MRPVHTISRATELKSRFASFFLLLFASHLLYGQRDSIRSIQPSEIKILRLRPLPEAEFLPDVNGFLLSSGRKTSLIRPDSRLQDLTSNQSRQLFARVPGITFWENDGSGIQTSIASRGLSPNRSWEFNMRQDGADISSDPFGYPEAYYTPPPEAVERIEIIRGAASLAFGPQFGGSVNYCIRKAKASSPIRFSTTQSVGSFGTFNSFQSFSGSAGKFAWTSWFHHRSAEGWRPASRYNTRSGFVSLLYAFRPNLILEANTTLFSMLSQQPGGLTDDAFLSGSVAAARTRNWFSTPWNLGSITLQHEVTENWKYELKLFGNRSERNSVGYVRPANVADTINQAIGAFNPRQVDRDFYRNLGLEFKSLLSWNLAGKTQVLSTGIRSFTGNTRRRQLGTGSSGQSYDLNISGDYGRSLFYESRNLAFFSEQLLRLLPNFLLTPGVRLEYLGNIGEGRFGTKEGETLPQQKKDRVFLLPGISASWKALPELEVYAGYSRAYRPVTFAELTPSAASESIDPALKDAKGYNAEFGIRGKNPLIRYDVNAFYLSYQNRIGLIGNLRTNTGNSFSRGMEAFMEIYPLHLLQTESEKTSGLSFFISGTWMQARYSGWKDSNPLKNLNGKSVEYAPECIVRSGMQLLFRQFSFSATWNYQSEIFTDALNTRTAGANAQTGLLPSFRILDMGTSLSLFSDYQLKFGVNNVLNERYATRRSGGYPGPGILPGLPRNFYLSFSANY